MTYENQTYSKRIAAEEIIVHRTCMLTGQGWKRISVFISICLAATSLTVGAFATLRPMDPTSLKTLQISGIILNSASIALSAITSLDWRSEAAQEVEFVKQLLTLVNVHGDGKMTLGRRRRHV